MPKNVTRTGSPNTAAADAAAKNRRRLQERDGKGQDHRRRRRQAHPPGARGQAHRVGGQRASRPTPSATPPASSPTPRRRSTPSSPARWARSRSSIPAPRATPGSIKDPAVLKGDTDKLEQQDVKGGKLFSGGVNGKDPQQNYIGDCYLIAVDERGGARGPQGHLLRVQAERRRHVHRPHLPRRTAPRYVPRSSRSTATCPRNDWHGAAYASDTTEGALARAAREGLRHPRRQLRQDRGRRPWRRDVGHHRQARRPTSICAARA